MRFHGEGGERAPPPPPPPPMPPIMAPYGFIIGLGAWQRKQLFLEAKTFAPQLPHVQSPGRELESCCEPPNWSPPPEPGLGARQRKQAVLDANTFAPQPEQVQSPGRTSPPSVIWESNAGLRSGFGERERSRPSSSSSLSRSPSRARDICSREMLDFCALRSADADLRRRVGVWVRLILTLRFVR